MMTIAQVRKAMKTADVILSASQITKSSTLYVKVDTQDLTDALNYLSKTGIKKIRATYAKRSKGLYIGE